MKHHGCNTLQKIYADQAIKPTSENRVAEVPNF